MNEASAQPEASGPHQGQPVREGGAVPEQAKAAVVLLHGRGATARSILSMADELAQPDVWYLAPQAAGRTWYPQSFLAPLAANEPGLSSGLRAVEDVLHRVNEAGIPPERAVLLGFSQGACLATEFAARTPRRYGGVASLSGGLIGTGEGDAEAPAEKRFDYDGDLAGTPVFFGCSDRDPHIPLRRVRDSAAVFRRLGADVEERVYEDMGHAVNEDELQYMRGLLTQLVQDA